MLQPDRTRRPHLWSKRSALNGTVNTAQNRDVDKKHPFVAMSPCMIRTLCTGGNEKHMNLDQILSAQTRIRVLHISKLILYE